MHSNLFEHGNEAEVYGFLRRDTKRNSKTIQIYDLLVGAGLAYLAFKHLPALDATIAIVAFLLFGQRLNTFIDQSNRNFLMHHMDWRRATHPAAKNDAMEF